MVERVNIYILKVDMLNLIYLYSKAGRAHKNLNNKYKLCYNILFNLYTIISIFYALFHNMSFEP
jgi:hypothetical protein